MDCHFTLNDKILSALKLFFPTLKVERGRCILAFMKLKKRQKLCSNCEGDIDLDVIVCPYCAADLREERPERTTPMQQMSHSLYPPPYPIKEEKVEEPLPLTPASLLLEDAPPPKESIAAAALPILLFALGAMLFLLGLLLVLFSHDGQVVLKWDARLWFLYLFASVPFLVFGYRAISKL